MAEKDTIQVKVVQVLQETPKIRRFILESCSAQPLPPFTGGSHIVVEMETADKKIANAYSLLSSPFNTEQYEIAVRLEEESRGGSEFMHNQVNEGSILTISSPENFFPIADSNGKHVLIAGGIGITPFLSQIDELKRSDKNFELHYCSSHVNNAAFTDYLKTTLSPDQLNLHFSEESGRIDLVALMQELEPDTHVYVCGPVSLNEAVIAQCRSSGLPENQIHWEQFGEADTQGDEFTVYLKKSDIELTVGADSSILKEIEKDSRVEVECLCRNGVCGTCEVPILEGEAEHLDDYFSDSEKQSQKSMLICVSRAKDRKIVLDL